MKVVSNSEIRRLVALLGKLKVTEKEEYNYICKFLLGVFFSTPMH